MNHVVEGGGREGGREGGSGMRGSGKLSEEESLLELCQCVLIPQLGFKFSSLPPLELFGAAPRRSKRTEHDCKNAGTIAAKTID
jgi:hypothetical protein